MTEEIKAIRRMLPREERFAQLAEEAAELSQAALKFRRALTGINPTPKTLAEAALDLQEEFTDVILCAKLLNLKPDTDVMEAKCKRWVNRLLEVQNGEGL